MRNTEQTLKVAIGELRCVSPGAPASLAELSALSVARDCIDEMLRSCVDELRTHPDETHSWSTIAYALGSSSVSDVRQRYASSLTDADQQVLSFWRTHVDRFAWDFLPVDFLHALYSEWMAAEFPDDRLLPKKAFTRRLKLGVAESEGWLYTRSRIGSLMNASEPLVEAIPRWSPAESDAPVYGIRRNAAARPSA